jgi:hypothetical protein
VREFAVALAAVAALGVDDLLQSLHYHHRSSCAEAFVPLGPLVRYLLGLCSARTVSVSRAVAVSTARRCGAPA